MNLKVTDLAKEVLIKRLNDKSEEDNAIRVVLNGFG